jgi:hypothetical protein
MDETGFYRILVAIETDATRFYGPDAVRPAVLGKADAEQMLSHIAADLGALLPEIPSCSRLTPFSRRSRKFPSTTGQTASSPAW